MWALMRAPWAENSEVILSECVLFSMIIRASTSGYVINYLI